jgi:pimeloyl-ACP methyl ester carboxylesterase
VENGNRRLRAIRIGLVAIALAISGGSAVAQWPFLARPGWLTGCTIAGLPDPAWCGTVTVSETPMRLSRRIPIRVVVVPARTEPRAPDPIVLLPGGPGQSAVDLVAALAQKAEALGDRRDLVLIEQRGTGESSGLHCEPPPSAVDLMGRIFEPGSLAVCRDQLSMRADLTRYTTTLAAGDYDRILEALRYRQVNVWGASYGTRLALEIARRFPHRVRTLLLESVVPMTFTWPTSGAGDLDAALDALIDDCAADEGCSRAFPAFAQDVVTAFAQLRGTAALVDVRDPATAAILRVPFSATDLAYATRGLLYGNDALALPLFFAEAARGRYDAFAQAYVSRARGLDREIARGVHLGVYCAEDLPFVDWPRAMEGAAGSRIGPYLLDEYRRACDVWPRASIPSWFRDPITITVPSLLMSGRRDPVTPPRTAEDTARTMSRARVLVWKYGGHGTDGLLGRECWTQLVREFIDSADPDRLSVACMDADPRRPFRLAR